MNSILGSIRRFELVTVAFIGVLGFSGEVGEGICDTVDMLGSEITPTKRATQDTA